ncbi:MAG: D-Ala-D-Ala carboxypeptidase family metallohydrolase [Leptolyngbyaceae cyanobacterium MO_188.B28]|nr:D-Ala-D-Ala carboxypeptidase family metallohydrolase [Leptolyngbyaceae cyanobacterium MO_188.B28]
MKVKVISDTLFKLKPILSGELPDSEKVFVKTGAVFEIESYIASQNNHFRVTLANQLLGQEETKVWYAFRPDVKIEPSPVKLEVVSNTLFKLKPVQSDRLSATEKVFIRSGAKFDLQTYLPAEGNHIKATISNAFLGSENRNIWYVYSPHIRIQGTLMKLQVVSDTLFKLKPVLSGELSDSEKLFVKNGTVFELHSHVPAENNHVKMALSSAFLGPENRNTWYAYAPDVRIEGNEPNNQPRDLKKADASPRGSIRLPGFSSTFYLSNPILPGGHFTWAEATKNGSRIPVNKNVVYGIIRIARVMEEVRKILGNRPISVNSWYRDPVTNRRVGGASRSRHLTGDAVDFVVAGIHPYDVYERLSPWWGSRGGLASARVFTHIDARGHYVRWSYELV